MRFEWNKFSFELPPKFEIQKEYLPPGDQTPEQTGGPPAAASTAAGLTICRPSGCTPGIFPIADNPEDLDPGAAQVTIALSAIQARYVGPPLRHLQQMTRVLPEYLHAFQVVTCEPYQVGSHEAARVHFSFETNFRIDQFIIAWRVDAEVVSATMTIPECDPDSGWRILQPFVDTFRP